MNIKNEIHELITMFDKIDNDPVYQKMFNTKVIRTFIKINDIMEQKPNNLKCICYDKFTQNHAEGAD